MKPEEVDRCMTLGAGYPMGPLALLDLVGIDVAMAIGEALFADSGEKHHRPPGRITELGGRGQARPQDGLGLLRLRRLSAESATASSGGSVASWITSSATVSPTASSASGSSLSGVSCAVSAYS